MKAGISSVPDIRLKRVGHTFSRCPRRRCKLRSGSDHWGVPAVSHAKSQWYTSQLILVCISFVASTAEVASHVVFRDIIDTFFPEMPCPYLHRRLRIFFGVLFNIVTLPSVIRQALSCYNRKVCRPPPA